MNVSRTKIRLDTSFFIHFDDNYFRMEGVLSNIAVEVGIINMAQ